MISPNDMAVVIDEWLVSVHAVARDPAGKGTDRRDEYVCLVADLLALARKMRKL